MIKGEVKLSLRGQKLPEAVVQLLVLDLQELASLDDGKHVVVVDAQGARVEISQNGLEGLRGQAVKFDLRPSAVDECWTKLDSVLQ